MKISIFQGHPFKRAIVGFSVSLLLYETDSLLSSKTDSLLACFTARFAHTVGEIHVQTDVAAFPMSRQNIDQRDVIHCVAHCRCLNKHQIFVFSYDRCWSAACPPLEITNIKFRIWASLVAQWWKICLPMQEIIEPGRSHMPKSN